jgi:hypothetical protein
VAITTTFLRRNSAVRQASELPEEQFNSGIPVCQNPKASPPLRSAEFPNSAASIDGSLQLPLSQSDKTSHQKQTFFSGGNSCVHSTSHNLFFSGKDYSLPQDVFMDPQNWNSNGFQYSWPGSAFIRLNIVATHAVGKTIFW